MLLILFPFWIIYITPVEMWTNLSVSVHIEDPRISSVIFHLSHMLQIALGTSYIFSLIKCLVLKKT